MKKNRIFIILCLVILLCGCGKGKLHEYDDFINYVENINLELNNNTYTADLKNKYEIINDVKGTDENNDENRILTFRIKNTDFTFDVSSSLQCGLLNIDGSCMKKYKLTDHYSESAFQYYIFKYNDKIGYNYDMCTSWDTKEMCYDNFLVSTNNDLKYVINYLDSFINFINEQDLKFITDKENFNIYFDKTNEMGRRYSLNISFSISTNGNYIFNFKEEYKPIDNKLSTYIQNYMNLENLYLDY